MAAAASSAVDTVVITGASRGIGLGLVEVYAAKGWRVIAAARDPAKADKLQALAKAQGAAKVSVVALDVSDSKSTAALPQALAALKVSSVELLINNAGIVGNFGTLEKESTDNFATVFRTNVTGVWEVTQAVLPLLRKAKASAAGGSGPKIANISSTMGSVQSTLDGPWAGLAAAYRVSKSALNELGAVQAREYNAATVTALAGSDAAAKAAAAPLITVVQVHPGWVDTDMGNGAGAKPPTSVVQSTTGIEAAVSAAKPNAKAIFVDFENKPVPW